MNLNEYQQAALRTERRRTSCEGFNIERTGEEERILEGVLGLSGESGEVVDILKKYLFQGHKFDRGHIAEELGDIAWYLALTADAIGYTLDDICRMNIEKLWNRYPDGFESERSVNREVGKARPEWVVRYD